MPEWMDLLQCLDNEVDMRNGIQYDEPLLNEPVSIGFLRDCFVRFGLLTKDSD